MKITEKSWPQHLVKSVETRKRDLVIRIANWTRDKDEPAYDVEVYIAGVYNWNESKTFSIKAEGGKQKAKNAAVTFAQAQIKKTYGD